ncbi:hypothetical protein L596_015294 [Steinernema carpocapsae]|uniref:RNA helicase n=1 Tax=Steinernema carpocapsae TaxID=34508 RepID=A0A4U5NFG2_STECR|nr:hypothetical protein L596_015294 [Steinernema carpocapsae]
MTTSWAEKETPATLASPTEEAAPAVQQAMGFVPEHKDKIEKWSETYSRKPGWMKINQKNTWYKEEPRAEQGRPVERRFPELPPKGANRKVDKLRKQREGLIITEYEKTIVNQVLADRVTILCGETGCGKSTQVVQYLVKAGMANKGRIAVTEPRRVAAQSLSRRVAEETNTKLGEEVGYKIRFDDCTSEKTIVQYMTDGVLLRECVGDSILSKYSVVIVDEAHERSINIDMLLGLLREIVNVRGNFKIVIMSATIDMEKFSAFFFKAPIIRIPGKSYNVEILFSENDDNFTWTHKPSENNIIKSISSTVELIIDEAEPNEAGDILIFLYGQDIIEDVCEELRQLKLPGLLILPLYRALPADMQKRIFDPTPRGQRKVIVATNIAESSLTIDGVKYVIDSGFMRVMKYSSINEVENLDTCTISHEHATQRAGRAGRTQPGICYRLYTEDYYNDKMAKHQVPELLRSNMVGTLLQIKAIGIRNVLNFDFLDPPKHLDMVQAHLELLKLKAIKPDGSLTELGERMALFPVDPYLSKLLLVAHHRWRCSLEMAKVVAMLSCLPILLNPHSKRGQKSTESTKEDQVAEEELAVEVKNNDAEVNLLEDVKTVVDKMLDVVVEEIDGWSTESFVPPTTESSGSSSQRKFFRPEGDLVAMLDAWDAFYLNDRSLSWCIANDVHHRSMIAAKEIFDQLLRIMKSAGMNPVSCADNMEAIQRTVADVMYYNLAVKGINEHTKRIAYHPIAKHRTYPISRTSVLYDTQPSYIIFNKINMRGEIFLSDATVVQKEWLPFDVPPPFSLDIARFRGFAFGVADEVDRLSSLVHGLYRPKKYGKCPLDEYKDLQKRLADDRREKTAKAYEKLMEASKFRPGGSRRDETDQQASTSLEATTTSSDAVTPELNE